MKTIIAALILLLAPPAMADESDLARAYDICQHHMALSTSPLGTVAHGWASGWESCEVIYDKLRTSHEAEVNAAIPAHTIKDAADLAFVKKVIGEK